MLGNNKKRARSRRLGFKSLGILCALMIPVLSASAGGALPVSARHSRGTLARHPSFYVNAGVGIDIFSSPSTNTIFGHTGATFLTELTQANRMINSSTVASLGIGYLFPVNRWFNLGARVFANYANNFDVYDDIQFFTINLFETANTTRAKLRNFEYGIDATPSVNIGANQFLTGIFGVAFNEVRIDSSTVLGGIAAANAETVQSSMRRSVTGLRLGVSLEELLSNYFGIYMNYIWTGYGSIHLLQSVDIPLRYAGDSDVNLQTHHIMLGLKYYFSSQHYQSNLRAIANHFNRIYLSFGLGELIPQYVGSGEFDATESGSAILHHNSFKQGAMVINGFVGMGYGFLIHRFYLGEEMLVNAADRNSISEFSLTSRARAFDKKVRINLNTFEGAFDLKFGGVIAPQTLLIFRAGVAINYLKIRDFLDYHRAAGIGGDVMQITQSESHTVVAPRIGVGLEKLFSDNMALTLNYVYTYYGHIFATSGTVVDGIASVNFTSANARAATHSVTLGFNYYFS